MRELIEALGKIHEEHREIQRRAAQSRRLVEQLIERAKRGREMTKQEIIEQKNRDGIYARNGTEERFWLVQAGVTTVYLALWKRSKDPKFEVLLSEPDPEVWDFIEFKVKK